VYSVENSMFNVAMAILFGGIGFVMRMYNYPPAPLVLALVLGPMLEKALRQSMQMSLGSPDIFFTRPVSAGILAFALVAAVYPILASLWSRRRGRAVASVG
jgi:putative tricarboxylic transport membrane protein